MYVCFSTFVSVCGCACVLYSGFDLLSRSRCVCVCVVFVYVCVGMRCTVARHV